MARPKSDPGQIPTVDRIRAAAEREFAERGYDNARLEDIAERVGIRRPSLLYHYGSKEKLYEAVIQTAFARLAGRLGEAIATEGDFRARVENLVTTYAGFLEVEPDFAPLVLRELLDGRGPGRQLILDGVGPLLDTLQAFAEAAGTPQLAGVPFRTVMLQLGVSALVRGAAGPLREPLWQGVDPLLPIALALWS